MNDDLKALFQSHHHEPEFRSVKDLIRYYRTGDSKNFKLGTQLSPLPREECPLMLCRDRTVHGKPHSGSGGDSGVPLDKEALPFIFQQDTVHIGERLSSGRFYEVLEATYKKEPVCVVQLKEGIPDRDRLTLYMQKDAQKCLAWRHDMIIRTYGVGLSPFYTVTQRVSEGSLDVLLRRRGDSVQIHHIIEATGQLAQALMYLEAHGYTHGNISAQSLLVSSFHSGGSLEIKLSSGAMTSYLATLPLTDKHNLARLPRIALERWTNLHNETSEADVFSFGMTVWEMCSRCERPLSNCTTMEEMKGFLESGKELPLPLLISNLAPADGKHDDSLSHEQFDTLVNVMHHKIILENCSSDPGRRMKPQDIVREITLLDRQFAVNKYDPVKHTEDSPPLVPVHSKQNGHSINLPKFGSGSTPGSRPLPSVPRADTYVIHQHEIIGMVGAKKLGAGFYGEVYLCKLKKDCDTEEKSCAVKRLVQVDRDSENDERAIKEFERELKIMVNLEHPNIVKVYGECFFAFPGGTISRLIVMEFVHEGSLSSFIYKTCKHLAVPERLSLYSTLSAHIADGMAFLHNVSDGHGIVHRDLAARNVLITERPHRAKITDFGLARRLEMKDYYRCSASSHLPILWCAPESISEYVFTKATDVWSYGVALWEMYSNGKKPVIPAVKKSLRDDGTEVLDVNSLLNILNSSEPGTRLERPRDAPPEIYNLMMKCWQSDPTKRPTFEGVKQELEYISLSHASHTLHTESPNHQTT